MKPSTALWNNPVCPYNKELTNPGGTTDYGGSSYLGVEGPCPEF